MTEPLRSIVGVVLAVSLGVGSMVGWHRWSTYSVARATAARGRWLGVHAPDALVTCDPGGALEPMICDVTTPRFSVPVKIICGLDACALWSGK